MPDLITMDGEYAYARDPYTQVRILCVDRPSVNAPIASMDAEGRIWGHYADGRATFDSRNDLIPLQRSHKPVEAWAVVGRGGDLICADAHRDYCETIVKPGQRLVRLIEDPEWRP
jgi:hypothetical protein